MNKKQKGFSLIELLIVVAIILIIAAIAIPNLLRARISANESSAVGSVRTITTTDTQYYSTYGIGYAVALANLGSPAGACVATAAQACLIDPVLTLGSKSGYNFANAGNNVVGVVLNGFETSANPGNIGVSGQRSFCSDQSGVIRLSTTGAVMTVAAAACSAVPTVLQ
ncbi:MAG TPA: prepilin-type N-terminal cleavage/methylation domain-containing protein [Candidatus Acidoferrales bacterium]|jgi:type IV pilus assembly protein PilA|nr:prepilin-type N-terminal cleavage/methylation domain-containing protein [Candidatus Acidoferrales bacterium]